MEVWDVADVGTSNILVLLYEDTDADGTVSSGDVFVDSIRTDANGDYEFLAPYNGGTDRFVLEIDTTTIGGNIVMTTDNKEVSVFTSGGNADINNDFGYNLINKITGTIFLDDDVDGVLDAGENGLSGVNRLFV